MPDIRTPVIPYTKKKVPHTFTENGTYNVPSGLSYDPITVAVEGGGTGTVDEELIITENGTIWPEDGIRPYPIVTEVPVPTDTTKTITENGRYEAPDLVRWKSVIVNVEGGGSAYPSPFYILDPEKMDEMAALAPQIPTAYNNYIYRSTTISFSPYIAKLQDPGYDSTRGVVWSAFKATYNGTANTAFFGRYGYYRAGLFFTTKIPHGIYSKMHMRYEFLAGADSSGEFLIGFYRNFLFGSDVFPDSSVRLDSYKLDAFTQDNDKVFDVSGITEDFYVGMWQYGGFLKIRALWFEIAEEDT